MWSLLLICGEQFVGALSPITFLWVQDQVQSCPFPLWLASCLQGAVCIWVFWGLVGRHGVRGWFELSGGHNAAHTLLSLLGGSEATLSSRWSCLSRMLSLSLGKTRVHLSMPSTEFELETGDGTSAGRGAMAEAHEKSLDTFPAVDWSHLQIHTTGSNLLAPLQLHVVMVPLLAAQPYPSGIPEGGSSLSVSQKPRTSDSPQALIKRKSPGPIPGSLNQNFCSWSSRIWAYKKDQWWLILEFLREPIALQVLLYQQVRVETSCISSDHSFALVYPFVTQMQTPPWSILHSWFLSCQRPLTRAWAFCLDLAFPALGNLGLTTCISLLIWVQF